MQINRDKLAKVPFSIAHPVKLTGLSAKVTPETKARFKEYIDKGYTGEDLIRLSCEALDFIREEQQRKLSSGEIKKNLKLLQKSG